MIPSYGEHHCKPDPHAETGRRRKGSCPDQFLRPFLYPCYFGTDVPSNRQLIASSRSVEEIRQLIGADSLGYLRVEDLKSMVDDLPLCSACF